MDYRSVNYTTEGHWKYERNGQSVNMEAQANAHRVLFETYWDEPWFAGGFLGSGTIVITGAAALLIPDPPINRREKWCGSGMTESERKNNPQESSKEFVELSEIPSLNQIN